MIRPVLLALSLLLSAAAGAAPAQAGDHWSGIADAISGQIAKAEALALDGKADEAKTAVTEAYFGLFETGKMEAALRKEVGSKHAYAREKQFGDLRKLVTRGSPAEIRELAAALRAGLAEDGKALDAANVSPDVFAVNQ